MTNEIPLPPDRIAKLLGWEGPGTHTSPSYNTVLMACQRGDLPAVQTGGRKSRWLILPSDAIAWRTGKRPSRSRRHAA